MVTEEDMKEEVCDTLGDAVERYGVDEIVCEIRQRYGLIVINSDEISDADYWNIVESCRLR